MATGKITKRSVDAASATSSKHFLWDDELSGFGLQVTPGGAKSYVYQYRTGGREASKRRFTIGRHGSPWTPATARAECQRLAMLVAQGVDPADAARERRREAVDLAFRAYIDTFTTGYLKQNWKDWQGAERLLRREPLDVLRDKPLPKIVRADLVGVLDKLADRPAVARIAHAILRKLFAWAEGRGDIDRSPIGAGFPAPRAVASRDRVLDDAELALAWEAAAALPYPFGPMFQLLIVTGARRDEAASLDWAELDKAAGTWTLPAGRAKNGRAHLVPLSTPAAAVLDRVASIGSAPANWPRSGLVFTTTGRTPVSGHSKAKAQLDRAMAGLAAKRAAEDVELVTEVPPWRIHDIRRTVATGLQRLGVRFEVTEAVLNHVSGARSGVAGVYQRHDWKDEKRTALNAWGRHLTALFQIDSPANVVSLRRST